MILITGATGTIGGELARQLTSRGVSLRAMTRDASRANLPAGTNLVPGDFDNPDSLLPALDGVTSVFLLTAPGSWIPKHDAAMIRAAEASGVRTVVKLSAIGTTTDETGPTSWHAAGERALRAGQLAWTVLRPSSFATNALHWASAIQAGDPVPNRTGDGAQGVVHPADVAAVAVQALLTDDHHGRTYTLTGPELLSVPDQVAQLGTELARDIQLVDVPAEAVRKQMIAAGWDPSVVEVSVAGSALVRAGGNATLTDDVEQVLGRKPRTFRDWVRENRGAFMT